MKAERSGPTRSTDAADTLVDRLAQPSADHATSRDASRHHLTTGRTRTYWQDTWAALRVRPLFWVSLFLIVIFLGMAVAPSLFVWPSPSAGNPSGAYCNLAQSRQGPSSQHWFGTDVQGCDYYTQVTWGARVSLLVALMTTSLTLTVGLFLGSLAGYYRGWVDMVISRLAGGVFALPYLLGAIIILSVLTSDEGRRLWQVAAAMAFLGWPALVRLFRSTVLQVGSLDFVQAARSMGATDRRIILLHVLPNAVGPSLVYATMSMGVVISLEATLSFLGVGMPHDSTSWGVMVAQAGDRIEQSPHLLFFPGLYLTSAGLGFVLMGEQLREALDPRQR